MTKKDEAILSDAEIAKRRDEVIRRMANTPPQPKLKSPKEKQGDASKANRRGND